MATYGLRVYRSAGNNYNPNIINLIYATQAVYNANTAAFNADSSGCINSRAKVIEAFANCRYATPNPSNSTIRYWMFNTMGSYSGLTNFNSYYYNTYINSSAAAQNAQNALRDRATSVLSPYPLRQNDNEVVPGSLSTQDTNGNCLTSLFLGVSDFNIPDHDLSFSYGTEHSNWGYDVATINNLANNSLSENNRTTSTNTSITAPNILGATHFDGNSSVSVQGSGSWYFPSATDFTIEFYFTTDVLSSTRKLLLRTTTNDIMVKIGALSSGNFIEITLGTTVYSIPNPLMGGIYKYTINTLYHLAITQNGTNLRVFIDGEKVLEVYAVLPTLGGSSNLTIGGLISGYSTGDAGHIGYIAAVRIVRGKAIYTNTFPKITRIAKTQRSFILTQYAKNSIAPLSPREIDIQYWMLNGIVANPSTTVFSTTDITWNQVDFFHMAASTSVSKTYRSCIGREISVSQFVIGTPDTTTTYRIGTYTTNSSTGVVTINTNAEVTVATYVLILMR